MPKRQHHAQSDDDEEGGGSQGNVSAKRARTAGSSDEEEASQVPRARVDKGKGKARDDSEEEDDDDDEEEDEEDGGRRGAGRNGAGAGVEDEMDEEEAEEEEFDRIHGPSLQRRLHKNRHKLGSIAEHGVIEEVEMTQFMCHKFLKFKFGPQINFIIGHNGSGKSAVLSAITVALGGKTASTGRGTGLKSFIREGQSVAEVTIRIKNQGEEAYRPEVYGPGIIITRRFNKDGGSTWKIRGMLSSKVVSSKKDELEAICDHMNIQVDNPMNVLTQDAARQFLSASKPEDKYKFFLRGTQLEQLSKEYDLCWENITQTEKLLAVKKEALPDLRERRDAARAKWSEADKAREQQAKIIELEKERLWACVAMKEEEMREKIEEHAKLERRLPRIEERISEAKQKFDTATEKVTALEMDVTSSESEALLNDKKTKIMSDMKANKVKIQALASDIKQMDSSVAMLNKTIEDLDKAQKKEERNMTVNTQAKREQTQAKITEARAAISSLDAHLSELSIRKRDLTADADKIKEQGIDWERKVKECQKVVAENEQCISAAKHREQDVYTTYGRNIKQLLERIRGMRWYGEVPVGPLGLYVKAKDPKKWGDILRTQLGGHLLSFAVTDMRDRSVLQRMLVESGNPRTSIIASERDMFEYESGEPPAGYLTVLRALEISDPYVLRVLINVSHIESLILAHTRKEGEDLLKSLRGGVAWSLDRMVVRVFPEGGVSSGLIRPPSGAISQLLTGRNASEDIRFFLEQKAQAENDQRAATASMNSLKAEYMAKKKEIAAIELEEKKTQQQLRQERTKLNGLQSEANAELPASLAGFEEAKIDAENEKQSILQQVQGVIANKAVVDSAQEKLQTELNEVRAAIADYDEQKSVIKKKIEDAVEVRLKAQTEIKFYEDKLRKEQKTVADALKEVQESERVFEKFTLDAQRSTGEPFLNPRKLKTVETNIDSLKKALNERAKTAGASIDTLAKQLNTAEETYDKAKTEIRSMSKLNQALRDSMLSRLDRWDLFRKHVALRCKHIFQYHLSQRGYYGKLFFRHETGTLNLRVQTDDQTQTQGARDKDPKSLSGGEKSFSTICLLLSLWECIGCPIRCLDEFDVFMDAVNRRISMKMMIDTANTSDRKQYILITPQDMTNIKITPSVCVLRMRDPERGTNGTLPFISASG